MRKNRIHIIVRSLINICRFILSVVFIFSGFVKTIDPKGFAYKIEEYLIHFHLDELTAGYIPLTLSVLLSVVEFLMGVYLFFGIRKRMTSLVVLLFMSIMTLLTCYIYYFNPVQDCGCFGDALVLSNGVTFVKNVLLLFGAVFLYRNRKLVFRIVSERNQWLISIYSIFFILFFAAWSLYYLPVFDFRPFRIGADIPSMLAASKQVEYDTEFILEKNGERRTFTLENYPDSTWTFVDSKTRSLSKDSSTDVVSDFVIYDLLSGEDVTEEMLADTTYSFWLIAPEIDSSVMYSDVVNDVYDYCIDNQFHFNCITASSLQETESWKQRIELQCKTYSADKKLLQTIIRSDPGLLLVKDGVILGKWSKNDFPDVNELPLLTNGAVIGPQNNLSTLLKSLMWYIFPLLFITLADRMWIGYTYYRRYRCRKTIIIKSKRNENENCSR